MRAQTSATDFNHGTEGKTNKDHACKLKARTEIIPQNLITLLECATIRAAESGPTTPLAETEPRPLAEAGHQRGLSQRRNTKQQRENVGSKTSRDMGSKLHETLEPFPRIRELMKSSFSTKGQKVAACVATSSL